MLEALLPRQGGALFPWAPVPLLLPCPRAGGPSVVAFLGYGRHRCSEHRWASLSSRPRFLCLLFWRRSSSLGMSSSLRPAQWLRLPRSPNTLLARARLLLFKHLPDAPWGSSRPLPPPRPLDQEQWGCGGRWATAGLLGTCTWPTSAPQSLTSRKEGRYRQPLLLQALWNPRCQAGVSSASFLPAPASPRTSPPDVFLQATQRCPEAHPLPFTASPQHYSGNVSFLIPL